MAYRAKNRRVLAVPSKIELAEIALLQDKRPGPEANKWVIFGFKPDRARKSWQKHGPEIMKEWLKTKPNTRPHCWYLFESPKLPKFADPEWPNAWAADPEKIPSKQKAFLDSLK